MRSGRYIEPNQSGEVIVGEAFAEVHHLCVAGEWVERIPLARGLRCRAALLGGVFADAGEQLGGAAHDRGLGRIAGQIG